MGFSPCSLCLTLLGLDSMGNPNLNLNLTHRSLAIILAVPKLWNFALHDSRLQNGYDMPAKADRW
jgi:hypothetical protein